MKEETVVGIALLAGAAVVVAIVAAIWLSVDSIANCSRSCGGRMGRYTEEPRMGSMARVPVCECISEAK